MRKKIKQSNTSELLSLVINAIQEKKGNDIISLNLAKLKDAVCEAFVICTCDSNTHALSVALHIEEKVKEELKERAWSKEGFENAQWILIDYVNVVVHIFQKPFRDFYNLESLWADGIISTHTEPTSK